MNILFDITHPAHLHLFRNFISYLEQNEHSVIITSREKDVLDKLLNHYELKAYNLSSPKKSTLGMLSELFKRTYEIIRLNKKHHFDVSFGTSVSIGFLKLIKKVPAYNFNEDDDRVVRKYILLAYPYASKIINPDCIEFKLWKSKRVLYNSFHELAYLHPNNFKPEKEILQKYNLTKNKYVIIRLSALKAHHDNGAAGISIELLKKIIEMAQKNYTIIKSVEKDKTHTIEPQDMHSLMAYAKAIISDSQTMTIEGAVLGIPAIRINTFINKSTVITELEKKYMLAYGFYPNQEKEIVEVIDYVLHDATVERMWEKRKEDLLKDKIDLNQWIINYFENQINKESN